MTKWELFKMLGGEHPLPRHFTDASGNLHFGILQSIEREDRSGQSFNVRIANQSGETTIHLNTCD